MRMTLQQLNLDTKTFEDIRDEMVASIQKYTDTWTNHNPSDPGITILEMLSWISETTLFRINRIPEESYTNFLRLVTGAYGIEEIDILLNDTFLDPSRRHILEFQKEIEEGNKTSITEMKANVLRFLTSRYRAVTEDDFRQLTIEASNESKIQAKVKRAIINKSNDDEKVEVVIVSQSPGHYKELISVIKEYLQPRTLIGTIIQVKQPIFTDVDIDVKVVCHNYVMPENVIDNIRTRILQHLDPFEGGDEKTGWPYTRPLTVYEIAQIIEETNGVKQSISILFDGEKTKIKKIEGLVNVSSINIEVVKEKK
jgi:mannose/fructose/N-acetylgalactosamine-specific phosphotransferase system component IIB